MTKCISKQNGSKLHCPQAKNHAYRTVYTYIHTHTHTHTHTHRIKEKHQKPQDGLSKGNGLILATQKKQFFAQND